MSTVVPRRTSVPAGGSVRNGSPLAGPNASPTTRPAPSMAGDGLVERHAAHVGDRRRGRGPCDTTTATSLSRGACWPSPGSMPDDLARRDVVAELLDLLGLELHGLERGLRLVEGAAGQPGRDGAGRRARSRRRAAPGSPLGSSAGTPSPSAITTSSGTSSDSTHGGVGREAAGVGEDLGGLVERSCRRGRWAPAPACCRARRSA